MILFLGPNYKGMNKMAKVLVIDDSAPMRKVLTGYM